MTAGGPLGTKNDCAGMETCDWLQLTPHTAPACPDPARIGQDSEVHIWRVKTNQSNTRALEPCLSEAERAHSRRFRFLEDRHEFIVARGFRRYLLSRYLRLPPSVLQFHHGPYGKPELAHELNKGRITFNISHSCGVILAAISVDREVGIDIEFLDSRVEFREFASLVFSSAEITRLSQLRMDEQQRSYFQHWTRKEAFVKASGEGISDRIRLLDIVPSDGSLVPVMSGISAAGHWTIKDLDVGGPFAASVVIAGRDHRFRFWDWSFYPNHSDQSTKPH